MNRQRSTHSGAPGSEKKKPASAANTAVLPSVAADPITASWQRAVGTFEGVRSSLEAGREGWVGGAWPCPTQWQSHPHWQPALESEADIVSQHVRCWGAPSQQRRVVVGALQHPSVEANRGARATVGLFSVPQPQFACQPV